ncbi:MAG: ABC transporter permease [Defluviitaleaceae bacterium]|nr:ABC transporter permease [Defluviitaleaceae bacterium]
MKIIDLIAMAMRNMLKRKLRTFLTVMGVVIGATSIIIMMSLGIAVNMNFDEQIAAMGHRALRIEIWRPWQPEPGEIAVLDDNVVAQIAAIPGIVIALPEVETNINVMAGPYIARWVRVIGITPEAMEAFGFQVLEGQGLDDSDDWQIVFGSQVVQQFADSRRPQMDWWEMQMRGITPPPMTIDPLNVPLQISYRHELGQPRPPGGSPMGQDSAAIRPYIAEGRGILLPSDDWRSMQNAFMPMEQVQRIIEDRERWEQQQGGGGMSGGIFMDESGNIVRINDEGYWRISALADSPQNIQRVIDDIIALGINEQNISNEATWVNSQRETTETLQTLLAVIGVIVLLVSAIGIANTMVMSIYERTKEIGVMKCIGASVGDIRRLFLIEAAFIGALGGAFGLGLAWLISYFLNNMANFAFFEMPQWMPVQVGSLVSFVPIWLYGLAFAFSIVIGLVSGFLPAHRATRISALAAIKTE